MDAQNLPPQLQQMMSSPLFSRAQEMYNACKTPEDLENVARNICQSKGIDFNDAFNQFKQMMNGIIDSSGK